MIQAVIFDLDGTLVQTEKLKAMSYARAAVKLCRRCVNEGEVVEAFKEVVGRSRQEVSLFLMERFGLEEAARSRMEEFGVKAAWQAFAQVRLPAQLIKPVSGRLEWLVDASAASRLRP